MGRKVIGMARRIDPTRSWPRRWRALLSFALVATASVVFMRTVLAVHDTGSLQLDGNASATDLGGNPSAVPPVAPSNGIDDWDEVCHQVVGSDCSTTLNTTGATAVEWTSDNLANGTPSLQASIFTGGGSKDPQNLNQWAWKDGAGGLPDKDNLLHSFAARYSLPPSTTCPSGTAATCEILFFGSDRYDNSGDAQQGFWFFQNKVSTTWDHDHNAGTAQVACPITVGGGTGFCDPTTGLAAAHRDGDLLVISNFSNGGTTSTISVYTWNSTVNGNLELLQTSAAANCNTAGPGDAFCGIVNAGTINLPWAFLDKSSTAGNGALNGEFYEGGVNLSLLGLGDECFASVASETRSSTSTTATLKDFVLGNFGNCGSTLVTTPKALGVSTYDSIPAGGVSIGTGGSISVKDSATLTITGVNTWSGTLSFHLCGPTYGTDYVPCTTGGVLIGSAATVTNTTAQPFLSSAATITAAGKYCWRGDFVHTTAGVPDATDASTGECFTVNPVQPTMTTNATSGSVTLGTPISDTATLAGTANKPGTGGTAPINPTTPGGAAGGTITFTAYGPDDATCSGTAAFTSSAIAVSGDGASYGSGNFTPTKAGTYRWIASYTGDSPNTLPKMGACNDANESTVVSPNQPAISTTATAGPVAVGTSLSDSASLTGTHAPSNGVYGKITFKAYGPHEDATTCTTLAYTSEIAITGDGSYSSASGSGGTFTPTAAGNYNWIASYAPGAGDVNNLLVSGTCGDANEGSIVVQLQPTIATAQTMTLKDSATITIADGGAGNLAGSVRFRLYRNATCDPANGGQVYDSNTNIPAGVPVVGSGPFPQSVTVHSEVVTFTTSQATLSWLVEYTSTNGGQHNVTSSCNTENASLTINNN
jgi:hypothetical protein